MDETRSGHDAHRQTGGEASVTPKARRSHNRAKSELHVSTLSNRRPDTKAGQIRWLWPEISAALSAGHTVKEVWRELSRDGIEIPYSKLRFYVAKLRRVHPIMTTPDNRGGELARAPLRLPVPQGDSVAASTGRFDPLANLREALANRPGFRFEERPPDPSKLF
jgi:hypothetical protein